MASETVASDHASATDEQIVNKEKSEAIADLITSLANEDEVKHDKPEDPNGGHTTPSSKTEAEMNHEFGAVEVQKSDDSPALEASAEVNQKHDKTKDAQTPAAPLSKTEEAPKPEPAVVVENTDDLVSLDAHIEDNLKEENQKEVILVSHATDDAGKSQPKEPPSTETTVEEIAQQLQKEPVEIEEEKQPEIVGIPEASAETVEKSDDTAEDIPQTESEAEVVKEGKTRVPKNEPEEKPQEAEQPTTVTIPELSTEAITIEEKTREFSAEILKETNESEAVHTETVKAEPVVTEVEENPKEPENQPLEKKEEEQSNTGAIARVPSTESGEAVEEKTSEPEVLKETNNYEEEPAKAEKAEPEFTKVDDNSTEPEKESFKHDEEELPKTVIPETETAGDMVEVHRREEADIEVVKEIDTSEAEAVPEEAQKPGDVVVVHQPIESDIEAVKESDTSQLEAVPAIEEKPEPVSTHVEEKPRELVEVAKDVGETSKEMETKQEVAFDTKIEETSDDNIKDPIPLKDEKTDKDVETSIIANTEQVSVNEEAEADPENLVEPSLKVTEKVAGVDEISSAVSEPARETLASKFEQETTETGVENLEKEQTEEPAKTDARVLEETPAKPAQKQSNNIISKVKQSLVKARKAIIGKSPSSKNHSTEAKDDIPVK